VFEHAGLRVGFSAAEYLTGRDAESSNRGRHPDRYNCLQWIALCLFAGQILAVEFRAILKGLTEA